MHAEKLVKSPWEHFYLVFSSFPGNLVCKMSPLVSGEILGLSLNIWTSDGKYPVQGCENLQLPIQMQLSEKRSIFSEFFIPFLESTSNFKDFQKKMILIANIFSKLHTVNILVRPLSKKRCFRSRFHIEHVKASLKTCESSMTELLSCFFIILSDVDFESVSPSVR